MIDLREHKDLIRQLVVDENEKDENWKWSVKSINKKKACIHWGYLEYLGCKEPFFTVELEDTGEGYWIHAKNEHGESFMMEIVEDYDMPFLNVPIDKAIRSVVSGIAYKAHSCY